MERVTFFESIGKILKTISSKPLFIMTLIFSLLLLTIMLFFYLNKKKHRRKLTLIIYCIVLCLLPLTHFSFFINTIDKIVENYIKVLYFPSCYVYIAILIITDVSLFFSLIKDLKDDKSNWYMVVDLVYFAIFKFLFFMIIRLIYENNIDVFERTQLYSNVNLTSCIQISSYLFWARIGIIFINRIINKLSYTESKKNIKPKENVAIDVVNSLELIDANNIDVNATSQEIIKNEGNNNSDANDNMIYEDSNNSLLKKLLGQDYTDKY